jgi:hypothetical protein
LSAPFVLFLYFDFARFYSDAVSASGGLFTEEEKLLKQSKIFSKKQVLPT